MLFSHLISGALALKLHDLHGGGGGGAVGCTGVVSVCNYYYFMIAPSNMHTADFPSDMIGNTSLKQSKRRVAWIHYRT